MFLPCETTVRWITGEILGGCCGSDGGSSISRYFETIKTEMK